MRVVSVFLPALVVKWGTSQKRKRGNILIWLTTWLILLFILERYGHELCHRTLTLGRQACIQLRDERYCGRTAETREQSMEKICLVSNSCN